ncbi:MAG: aldolase/citrate lyase family protein [Alphaproteobacteria bacterium]|nr:aldolase/citrate lyase family protein [Alphaproteobacteria bacterium]
MFRDNALKQRLAEGKSALGAWCATQSAVAAEILGHAGYDFILIDHEHGFGGYTDSLALLQALQAFPATVILRVPVNDPVPIKRALDIGAEGIMVPMVESAADANAAVAAARYPPAGIRGCATTVVRAADYGLRADDYLARADAQVFVMVQIETPRAVENIPEIAAVEGVDALFIGPADLAANVGHPGDFDHPDVSAAFARAEDAIKASGKPMGNVPFGGLDWRALFDRGYRIVAAGSDVGFLREGARAQVAAYRREID